MDRTVKETEALTKILQTLFARLPVSVEIKNRSYPAKIVGIKDGLYLLASLPGKSDGEKTRILFLTHNNHFFHGVFTVVQRNEGNGLELLRIQAVKVSEAKRAQGRVELENGGEPIILTNIINQLHLRRSLGFIDKIVENILQKHSKKMKETYPDSLIYFSDRMDNRLRIMYNFEQSIFVTNRTERSSGGAGQNFVPIEEYLKLLALNKIESRFISEISVLIRYKNYTPLGYVQVLSDRPLDTEDYNKITLFAAAISRDVIASGFFQESKERCIAEDISRSGLGFFHPQSIFFSRSFAVGEILLFDLQMNQELRGTYRAVIRNITNTDKMFRIGLQFFNLNSKEEEMLNQFVDSRLGPGEGSQAPESSVQGSGPPSEETVGAIEGSAPEMETVSEEVPDMGFEGEEESV
ncbi:PilZ domain-containing protein [Leptospira licerasiae]|uniref:Type IV pilus assembly protein PilZ n=1 Tax=Leptospira licerasiae str. MMD4847 TaxID=1049971 RepID=A0ABP2RF51_9LEPT|nr:PilZ domain-containing protein [Leptospira licerasiae]EIE00104.1 type IV pilus assembly protein PilZ [Leptospira licerasiae serovar Varillal str. VAR 010]EJZ42081.1 type IV pilus assembly protein PilZ [Leptospira licerasiae str. MMD4847]